VEKAKYHLIGVIAHGLGSWVYTMSDKWKSDANVTIEVLQRVLTAIEQQRGGLPSTLYVQMDNCARENKNQWVLAYLSWLVQRGVFQEIHLSFLPVGHTHEDIDQLFSRLAVYLRGHNAIDRTMLYEGIVKAFHQFGHTPICSHLESVACIRPLLGKYMEPIGNHAGRDVQHFLFKPHSKGASMFTKSHAYQVAWDVYDDANRDERDRGFHLIKPNIPSPPFDEEHRPGPSAPKPLVFPEKGSANEEDQEDITVTKILKGLEMMTNDQRCSPEQLRHLHEDLQDFRNREPVPFSWPYDGQFEKERQALVRSILAPAAGRMVASAAAAAAAAAAVPAAVQSYRRPNRNEAAAHVASTAQLEKARVALMESEIDKLLACKKAPRVNDELSFLNTLTPAVKAAAAATGFSSSALAAAAAASSLKRGALHDAVDKASHSHLVTYQNSVKKAFPDRLSVGDFLVLKPKLDDHPEVTLAAEAAVAAATSSMAAAAAAAAAATPSTHRTQRPPARAARKAASAAAVAAAAAAAAAPGPEGDVSMESDGEDSDEEKQIKKRRSNKRKKAGKKKPAAASNIRPFWLGKVLKFNRNDGWIRFEDWTPYVSREGVNRNKIGDAFEGNYFPDRDKKGEPIIHYARWHPEERHLWTFFKAEYGMSEHGNLYECVKKRLQEIISGDPPIRAALKRAPGKKKFPDDSWNSAESSEMN